MKLDKSNCPHEEMIEQVVDLSGERHGETFIVRVPGLACPACGFATINNRQSGVFTQAVSDAYRKAHDLLRGAEIRELRARLGMSQIDFADYLGVGVASIKRWESGKIQEKAMDELIRLKTDPDAALRNSNILNADRRLLFEWTEDVQQVYRPHAKIGLDTSSLEDDMLVEHDGPVAA